MKEKKIFDAITDVHDNLVEEARTTKLKKKGKTWQKVTALAACATLIIGMGTLIPRGGKLGDSSLLDVIYPKAYAFDDFDAKRAFIAENPVDNDFLTAINNFSYKTAAVILKDTGKNINYSPLSLYYALAFATSGAKGETAEQLLSLLGISDQNNLSKQCGNLYRQLYTDNEIGKLKIANSLWMDNDMNGKQVDFKEAFVKNAAENFYASSHSVDFSNKETGKIMAKWVSDNTNGILSPEVTVNPEQILSILNTVYFYDQWLYCFDKSKTAQDVFYLQDGNKINCSFMNSSNGSANFAKGDRFTRAGLSLKNGSKMVFILPDVGVSPSELLSSPERMHDVFEGGKDSYGKVVWQIPKFNFESKIDLAEVMKALGVNAAFQKDADFSGITNQKVFISNIYQETHVAVDENGVEAAAFTEIMFSGSAKPVGKADMILNRPFIYGITAPNGNLLFVGVCENPIK